MRPLAELFSFVDCRTKCVDKASCEAITGEDGAASVEMNNCLTQCDVA